MCVSLAQGSSSCSMNHVRDTSPSSVFSNGGSHTSTTSILSAAAIVELGALGIASRTYGSVTSRPDAEEGFSISPGRGVFEIKHSARR